MIRGRLPRFSKRLGAPVLLLPLTAAIPVSEARSLWELIAAGYWALCLLDASRVPSSRWIRWLPVAAIVGYGVGGLQSSASVTDIAGPMVAAAALSGTCLWFLKLRGRGRRVFVTALSALALGVLASRLGAFESADISSLWKYAAGVPVTVIALGLAFLRRSRVAEFGVIATLALVSIGTGSRNLAAALVLAGLVVFVSARGDRRTVVLRATNVVFAIALFVVLGRSVIGGLAESTLLSNTAQRFADQASINANPVLAARPEPPMSLAAVNEHFWIGAGPDPAVTPSLVADAHLIARDLGYRNPEALEAWWTHSDTLYLHSALAQQWVVGGVLAATLGLYVWISVAARLVTSVLRKPGPSMLLAYLSIQALWDAVLSPEIEGSVALLGLTVALGIPLGSSEVNEAPQSRAQSRASQVPAHA